MPPVAIVWAAMWTVAPLIPVSKARILLIFGGVTVVYPVSSSSGSLANRMLNAGARHYFDIPFVLDY
jgi:hypothetical protein